MEKNIWGPQLIKNIFIKLVGIMQDHNEYKNVKMKCAGDIWRL